MVPNIPDHYLWLGLGAFTFVLIQHVSTGLRTVKHLTTVNTPAPKPPGLPTPTSQEDAIKTTSLLTLATSHNTDIRTAATKLLCERFVAHDGARNKLLKDIGSDNPAVQRKAKHAFRLLRSHGVLGAHTDFRYGIGGLQPRVPWDEAEVWGGGGGGGRVREPLREILGHEGEEERDARRRRREAVVIHEGEGRIGEGDVWMRDREGVMSLDMEIGELVIDGVAH
ncbi:hypothetical protein E8E13_006428 [Curvularia kusanoi]|uniref:Uncharacterized protein n=1 Tax=Curvularia kusanoi TaxID=90978 RepID=A0A9P4W618_CURKU|nr:hypothetical protein E8E13_006428 [Curvularia kusanoi]